MVTPRIEVSDNPELIDLVQQAADQTAIGLTIHGEEKAIIMSMQTFRTLLGLQSTTLANRLTWQELAQQYQKAIASTGNGSRETILDLIQTVKQELASERDQRLAQRHMQASEPLE